MGMKTYVAGIAAMALLGFIPMTIADPQDELIDPIAEALCAEVPEEGEPVHERLHVMPWPTLEDPFMTLTTHVICLSDIASPLDTDCTSQAYNLTGWHWTAAYSGKLDTANPYGLSSSGLVSAFNSGGNTWDNTVSADIFGSISAGGSAGKIRQLDGVNQHGFKKGGGYVAVTYTWAYQDGRAAESDAAYNTLYPWSLSGEASKMDVLNVQTHEIGHTFGLGHPASNSANACLTMYAYVNYGQTSARTLGDGDINGINAIY